MYNRYIRNDQGTYTRIPEEEPRHTQGGTCLLYTSDAADE